jgi:hypothetical protein
LAQAGTEALISSLPDCLAVLKRASVLEHHISISRGAVFGPARTCLACSLVRVEFSARLCNLFKEYVMSGANRPSGPATRKSLDLADQIERDELENNLPDALNRVDDEDDLDDASDSERTLGR